MNDVADRADSFWMRRALAEAARGRGTVEPNPMVGAVIVRAGSLIGVGHHERFGGPHAEIVALQAAGDGAEGAELLVTLEPCCHHGKTPPCTDAILRAGISRVVGAMTDPFSRVGGQGYARLREAGLTVEVGVEEAAARQLNAPYLKRMAMKRPYVTAKWAMTLDGKTATRDGHSQWISGARSRAFVHELRGRMDAILVGIETVLADDPLLTARPAGPRTPVRIVLDSAGRLPLTSRLVLTAREIPTWVAVTQRAPEVRMEALAALGCTILRYQEPTAVPIGSLLDDLGARDITNLLVEGGGRVLGAFLDAGEVDAIEVFVAPVIEGGDHARTPARGLGVVSMERALRLAEQQVAVIDGDIWIRGTIPR